jgi:hypothetical protein
MILSQNECNKIASKLSNTIKHKLGLAKTAPNNMLYNNKEYGMFHIWDRQMLLHGNNWTTCMNSKNLAGQCTYIRAQ